MTRERTHQRTRRGREGAVMVGLATFMIVSREDVPLYEADLGKAPEASSSSTHGAGAGAGAATAAGQGQGQQHPGAQAQRRDDAAHLHQFVMHAAQDFVEERMWETNGPYLKLVDRFNDLYTYAWVTAGGCKFLLLHDARNEENVRSFFDEVHQLYLRVALNPFHTPRTPIENEMFDRRVRQAGRRYFP